MIQNIDKHLILKGYPLIAISAVAFVGLVRHVSGKSLTVDNDGGTEFESINDDLEAAEGGDTIRIWVGTYYENVVVDISVSLYGNESVNTTIDEGRSGDVVKITADWVNMSGFTAIGRGDDWGDSGIMVESVIQTKY